MNETDAYAMLQSLGDYCEVNIADSYGTIQKQLRHGRTAEAEGHTYKVTVSNTAPADPTWPLVVFTGVGLAFNPKKYNNSIIMKRKTNYKVDLSNAPQGGGWGLLGDKQQYQKVDVGQYPMATSDESKHGFFLYPGQAITFEMNIEPEDLENVWVEGTLSRRHLFHFIKELMPSSS